MGEGGGQALLVAASTGRGAQAAGGDAQAAGGGFQQGEIEGGGKGSFPYGKNLCFGGGEIQP